MDPLLGLIALCEKGIAFISERKRQKEALFDDVIDPLQKAFEKMYEQHLATFARVQEMITDRKAAPAEIVALVEDRVLFEGGAIDRLGFLAEPPQPGSWQYAPEIGEVAELYRSYVHSVATCLVSPTRYPQRFQVGYYLALADVANSLSHKHDRSSASRDLKRIV